jgi:hypothetical protein
MKHFENVWSEEAREDARFDLGPQRDASHSRQTLAHNMTPHTAGRPAEWIGPRYCRVLTRHLQTV